MYSIGSSGLYRCPGGATVRIDGTDYIARQKLTVDPMYHAGSDPSRVIIVSAAIYGIANYLSGSYEILGNKVTIKGDNPFQMVVNPSEKTVKLNEAHSSYITKGIIMFYYTLVTGRYECPSSATRDEYVAYWCDAIYEQSIRDDNVTVLISGEDFPAEEFDADDSFVVRMTTKKEDEETADSKPSFLKAFDTRLSEGEFKIECPDDVTNLPGGTYLDMTFFDTYVLNEITKYCIPKAHKAMLSGDALMKKYDYDINAIPESEYEAHMKKHAFSICLIGDPGSGKTSVGQAVAAALNAPFFDLVCSANTEENSFQGGARMKEGSLVFEEGPFATGFQHRSVVLLDEPNMASPAVLACLNKAFDNRARIDLDGCRPVRRDPRCVVITAHNIGTVGSDSMNEAFDRRFRYTQVVELPTRDEFIEFLLRYNPDKRLCVWVYDAFEKIKNALKGYDDPVAEEAFRALSIDSCFAVMDDIEDGVAPERALNNIWAKIYDRNKLYAQEIHENVISRLPTYKKK